MLFSQNSSNGGLLASPLLLKRQVFYSFHYYNDHWRASQVRNIGVVEGNRPATDNDWETVTKSGERAIENWINNQMKGRSCLVLLIGSETAGRKWIKYEITKAWELKMGVVGIYVHNLKNQGQSTARQGINPFAEFNLNGVSLDSIVKSYNPPYWDSKQVYKYIADNIRVWTNEAVEIRKKY
jgi:hypothetical protein